MAPTPSNDIHQSTIVVVGAGIIGLTSALKLQAAVRENPATRRTNVLLVSREWPTSIPGTPIQNSADFASMWAGAHVRPIPATTPQLRREAQWLKHAVEEFAQQVKTEPWIGIRQVPGIEYLEAPTADYEEQDATSFELETGLPGYRKYAADELPEGIRLGFEYDTYCINAPLYCGNLLRKFVLQGGRTLKRDLKSEWEAYSLTPSVKLVVNASGVGFGDPKCYPIRGQTVLTNLTSAVKTVTRQSRDGSWSFIIPRSFNGGTVIGGTKEPNDWRVEPSVDTRHRLLASAQDIIPHAINDRHAGEVDLQVIKDVVGRRPAREGGMRLEVEARTGDNGQSRHVIHAYGAGGRGYEISWGVADEVAELARKLAPFASASAPAVESKL
ncbi:Fc.00g044830.m01.CDS01 [Cosmosporella sp. VM-42]